MRPIEIRGNVRDIDDLVRRGRALHGAAVCRLVTAGCRGVRRQVGKIAEWRRARAHARLLRASGIRNPA